MGVREMEVLDSSGHTKTTWDSSNAAEVSAAKATFENLTSKRYKAFKVKSDGSEGSPMRDFDPEAEKMILVPPVVGG